MVELVRPGQDYIGTLDSLYDGDQPVIQVNSSKFQRSLRKKCMLLTVL